ncbi:galacturonokinase isoform X2 [Diospyros lotus]|uniref:galacturonokinase isoform X2 n=1 Tax=Diospyros lotus TaxID=55363 RepID=UPI0022516ABB|nr:galacturonokinase isoform X2 [Diospyros lotus]
MPSSSEPFDSQFGDHSKKMDELSWPSKTQFDEIRKMVAEMAGRGTEDVKVVVSPYRICPLGAHIDHQGGTVSAMTINRGILLGFVPSGDSQVLLHSGQFKGEVRFSVDEFQHPRHTVIGSNQVNGSGSSKVDEECSWGNYARGALYALQSRGNHLTQGIIGFICGSEDLDSSGLSSSAAVGVAYLLAFESANNLPLSPTENIEYDRLVENEYLGLRNGILDQSAILLSRYGCLTCMNCKTKEYKLVHPPKFQSHGNQMEKAYKILLAFSGLKQALTTNPGYNNRVAECQEAARLLLHASGNGGVEPLLSNVELTVYEKHKSKLEPTLARRAEHYFSENMRVKKGCGPLIELYEILLRAPGVYGARFSGAGFRGCCIAFVDASRATKAASFVKEEYQKRQPDQASKLNPESAVLICDAGDCARVI